MSPGSREKALGAARAPFSSSPRPARNAGPVSIFLCFFESGCVDLGESGMLSDGRVKKGRGTRFKPRLSGGSRLEAVSLLSAFVPESSSTGCTERPLALDAICGSHDAVCP